MNLRQLELFVAVADSGSFSRAAELTLRTQSTVSQQIAGLENECGLRLFDRTGRGVELTEGGRVLLTQARRVQAELAGLHRTMARFQGLEETLLTVGASTIPGTYLLPRLLPELLRRHPGIALTVVSGDSRQVLAQLGDGVSELAVVGNRSAQAGCDFTRLAPDLLVLVVGPGHRWRQQPSIPPAALLEEPLLLRESGSGSGQALLAALQAQGLDPAQLCIAARLGSSEAIKEVLLGGFGAAFLSELAVRREVARGELQIVPVAGLSVPRDFWVATRTGRSLSPAAAAFLALLQQAAAVAPANPG